MPRVYDQQIAWQPTGTQKMQYDRLQDFITPAMENAARAADNIQQAIVSIQDKQVADAADALAQKQADIINNFDEFSLKDPQGEMVNRSMKEWDKFIAEMPVEARRRFERNNPKAREIFELKTTEAATKRARNYANAQAKADVPRAAQDIIARSGGDPRKIQVFMQQKEAEMSKSMTPEDFIEYQKTLGYAVQQGAIDDAISHGNLAQAKALNNRREFTKNLTPEQVAKNRMTIQRLLDKEEKDEDGSGSGKSKGPSFYDGLIIAQQKAGHNADTAGAAARATNVYNSIASGASIENVKRMGDVPLLDENGNPVLDKDGNPVVMETIDDKTIIAGGKTLAEIYNMYPAQRQKLMEDAKKAAALSNSPASTEAMSYVNRISATMTEVEMAKDVSEKLQAQEELDGLVLDAMSNGYEDLMDLVLPDSYKKTYADAKASSLARTDQMNQTMASASKVYGHSRADFGDNKLYDVDTYNATGVMPLPHTPASEAEAILDTAKWTGKMSKADLIVPQKVDKAIAGNVLWSPKSGLEESKYVESAEQNEMVPKGFTEQYRADVADLQNGVTPMCLTTGVTYKEYEDCLRKNGWSPKYKQGAEYDPDKRRVVTLAASGRIYGRGQKDADYNEGTYAWALDAIDGVIWNEVVKNEVYAQESGLTNLPLPVLNSTARQFRQRLRTTGKFDEYVDTSHFDDNGFDPFNPNAKPECATDIKKSALYDFVNTRIVSLGGKADTPQAEKIAEYLRGAIKGRDIKMEADYNKKTEYKTVNPENRGIGKVSKAKANNVVKSILKANEEE